MRSETPQLALDLLPHLIGQVGLPDAVAELLSLLFLRVRLPQLLLDRLELLPQHVVLLLLAHLALGLAGDLLAQLEDTQLVGEVVVDEPESVDSSGRLEQRLLSLDVQSEHRGDQEGQHERVRRLGRKLVDIDGARGLGELDDPGRLLKRVAMEGLDLKPFVRRQW